VVSTHTFQRGVLARNLGRPRDGCGDLGVARLFSIARFALLLRLGSRLFKGLLKVCNDVVDMFGTDRDTDKILKNYQSWFMTYGCSLYLSNTRSQPLLLA
jgi:hypothetical protein